MRTQLQKIAILILVVSSFLTANISGQEIVKSMGKFVPVAKNGMAINPNPVEGTSIAQISGKADGVNGVFKIPSGPYQGQSVFAGTFAGTIDGNNAKFYCVDLTHGIKYNEDYEDNGNTSAEITYIMNNYFPYAQGPNELSDLDKEASAVQIALWHFSDGATVDQNSVSNSTVRNRALDIIADANANAAGTVTPSTLSISPSSQNVPSNANASFNVRVEDANGNGVPNVTVNLSSTSGTLSSNSVTTNANGDATFTLSQGSSNNAVVTATADLEIPQGTKYVHKASPNQYQKLVLATPITVSAQAAASVFWGDGQDLCITLSDGSKFTIGRLYTTTLQNGDVKVRLEISKDYNDNTYQEKNTTPIYAIGWPNDKHDFKALHKSDKAEFEIFDNNGNSLVRFELDYLEQGMSGYPSGYGPRIESIVSGNSNYIKDINSSLSRNFNDYNYVLTQHSPATDNNYTPNPSYPNWEFGMIYEFTVDQSANFGSVDVVSLHNSPNKLGTDKQTFPELCVTTTPGSLGDKVWEDANEDGIQDFGESGLANVTVELYDCNGNLITSTLTDNDGNYLFSNLTPGDYTVKFVSPSGYVITTQNAGSDDAVDSDANPSDGKTTCITIASGDNNLSVDAGMYKPKFKIGDYVWHDKNYNGIQDAGESGIENVKVNLIKNGNSIASTFTDANGYYEFNNLFAGSYEVEIDASNFASNGVLKNAADEKWYASPKNQGSDDAVDSDGDETTHKASVTLSNADDLTIDFGFFKTSFTFDKSGPQSVNAGDVITYTFTVVNTGDLVLHGGVSIFDALINPSGNHQIWNGVVNPGETKTITKTYTTTADDCGNLVNNANAVGHPVIGNTAYPNIEAADSWTTNVICQKGSIGDKVWNDADKDGIQDNGEAGIDGVTVKLLDSNGNTVQTTITANGGLYKFNNLDHGTYFVKFILPSNYAFSPKDSGNDDAVDSDANTSNGKTDAITLSPGQDITTVDAGMYDNRKAKIGDFVWNDTNMNGIQDNGETGISGVTVKLRNNNNSVVATTTTNNGNYLFSNVEPGSYTVEFVLPSNYVFSPKDQGGDDTKDSDVNTTGKTDAFSVAPGDNNTTIDAGMYDNRKASLGDYVWNDTDKDGIQDQGETGIANVTVKLFKSDGTPAGTTLTNSNGAYSFSNLVPGSYYVQFVLPQNYAFSPKDQGSDDSKDSDANTTNGKTGNYTLNPGDNVTTVDAGMYDNRKASLGDFVWVDANGNGKQDQGENGIDGVTVKLYDNNNQLIDTKVTANQGSYLFDQLDAGTYYVKFFLPTGYMFTVPNVNNNTNDAIDSDADVTTGKTGNYNLNPGDNETTVDAGLIDNRPASVGDYVWNDVNGNGIQDDGNTGVSGVTVNLIDNNGNTVQTTSTNNSGYYQFTNVTPGTYTVEFVLPSNYTFSPKDQGNDDAKDSDANPNGKTDPFTLNHGDNITTIDAGIKEIPLQPATIGDFVWNDLDHDGVQDQGENGYANVTVKLFTCTGTLKDVTTTDANGHYSFTIPANELGDYYVEFDLPQGYMFSPKDNASGNNADEIDSDADGNGKTDCITINSGSTNDTWDAGIYEIPATSDLSLTKSVSNANPNDGDQITYTVTVTNHGPADATGVEVTDVLPDGLVFVSASASAGSYVDSTGIWTIGSIAANSNATLEITATVDVQSCITGTIDLGPATGFNLFVWKDFKAPSSDVEGKVAVGRDAELSNYSIADKLNSSYAGTDVFIVNRDLYFTSGRVYVGNATYGRSTNLPKQNVTIDGTLRKDKPIDFAAAKAYLKNLSTTLSSYAVNGNTTYQWSGVFLEGNDPYLNVFNVSGAELTNSTYMDIKVPNGSVVLVNVNGKHITWNGGLTVTGTSITNVLYNFYKARTLEISGIDVRGSILAPFANVTFNSGLISGQLIAKSMFGNGQINNYPFVGNVPCPSEIVNVAEVSAADQGDPDSTPGNGDDTEDDYASATINIGSTSGGGSGGGNGGGSGDNGNWDVASQFPFQEIVWTMANDLQGNMLAGTIGGHLFISYDDGANWTQINQNLVVGFIWDIAVHPTTGAIAIGTEQGVYYTTNDGATWNGPVLTGDVRALIFDANGNAYAGVWGLGVFKSTNNGQTWTATSNGLSPYGFAVQSLAIDVNGDIYAGTFGGGVYKSNDEGATWTMLNVGYAYVWSVAVDSHLNVYAATYGAGIYKSSDAGANWYAYNNGLDAAFVYSVIVDANDNVYAATWLGGIYKLTNAPTPTAGGENVASNSWESLGLGGVGISSLLVNPANGTLYAGSNDGAVYMQSGSTTGVNDELEIPKEFSLAQNYPNPFNPSTTIKFGVPKDGEYSLKVYNVLGQLVATLINGQVQAGYHEVNFNANSLSSGIYIYRFQGKNVVITKKMILMK